MNVFIWELHFCVISVRIVSFRIEGVNFPLQLSMNRPTGLVKVPEDDISFRGPPPISPGISIAGIFRRQ